jgi:hypothetical protein
MAELPENTASSSSLPTTDEVNEAFETVTLQVQLPPDIAVGSTVNVLYEDNYYQIVVPENGPGNSIQVILPSVLARVERTASDVKAPASEAKREGPSRMVVGAAVGAAVVSAVFIGPIITGAVILGGAAVYVVSKRRHGREDVHDPDAALSRSASMRAQASNTIRGIDEKYAISATASKVVNATVTKAREIDERAHLSATVSSVSSTVVQKVRDADGKYQISAKTGEAWQNTVEAVKQFDESHHISASAAAAAKQAASKAKEIDSKYEISSSIGKVWSSTVEKLTGNPQAEQPYRDEMEGQLQD